MLTPPRNGAVELGISIFLIIQRIEIQCQEKTPIFSKSDMYIIYMKYKYISFNKLIFLHLQLFPTILLFHIYIVIMMIAVITNNFHGKEDQKCLTTADI